MRALAFVLVLVLSGTASAQRYGNTPPRIGAGFELTSAFYSQDVIPDGPALGVRGRVALPINADVSLGASLGVGAHLFGGADDTRFVLSPQTSVIVTLPGGRDAVRYAFGGLGGFLPLSGGGGGPTIHAGFGWAIPLTETSVFVEVNPSLIVGQEEAVPVLAVRTGVIF